MKRRRFLQATAAAPALLTGACTRQQTIPGSIVGAAASIGHRLRDLKALPAPTRTVKTDVLIAGAGIAGLAAARQLQRQGLEDFLVLDLESQAGGNSTSGSNRISAYPWGAHYVPLPGRDCHEVLAFFEEIGLIQGHDAAGRPIYDELALCHDPHERLFIHGQWENGLLPLTGLTPREREEFAAFDAAIHHWQEKRAFTLPLDRSSRDPDLLALDRLTMDAWMHQQGWTTAPLRWYVDYACRDDFGGSLGQVSAWAGIHYFASRSGEAANATRGTVLTWPEGNGYLVKQLVSPLSSRLRTGSIVLHMQVAQGRTLTDVMEAATGEVIRYESRAALCALPRFIAQRLIPGLQPLALNYAPWVVTNLTLDELPPSPGVLPAWDSVIYQGPSLGYINATHQALTAVPQATVITHYEALCDLPPGQSRQWMQQQTHAQWTQRALTSLQAAHPDLARHVQQADIWLWGHGMIRPDPGFIWGADRAAMLQQTPPLFYAHSDMSGMSLFEEAYTRGVLTAQDIRQWLA